MGWEESGFNRWGGQGDRARVILVLRECIWNASAVSLVLPALDDIGSMCFLRVKCGLSPCLNGSTLGDCLLFSYGEYGC